MSRQPSKVFLAAIEANAHVETLLEKLRNTGRRPLTKSERYAINLVSAALDRVDEHVQGREVAA